MVVLYPVLLAEIRTSSPDSSDFLMSSKMLSTMIADCCLERPIYLIAEGLNAVITDPGMAWLP
jgi:hypothetical protein